MRKLIVLLFFGLVHKSFGSRVRFEQPFPEQMYRHEPHFRNEPIMHMEPVFKREHIFPRNSMIQAEQILSQPLRNEQIYGSNPLPPPSGVIPNEEYLQSEPIMQNGPIVRNEPFIPSDSVFRRESMMRREPVFRREPFVRTEPMLRNERIFQGLPALREEPIFRNQPNYAVMVTQCQCPPEAQGIGQMAPQESFFPIQSPIQTQPMVHHRIVCPKPVIKPPMYQQMVAFPRMQRFVRKDFRPLAENIQFSPPPPVPPPQEFNSFSSQPIQFPENFSNQGPPSENTSEPSQNTPVTVRNVSQMPPPLNLAQMSSIC